MHRSPLLILLGLSLASTQAWAQDVEPEDRPAVVTFVVSGGFYSGDEPPLAVLEALEQQASLQQLQVEGRYGGPGIDTRIEARFVFDDMAEFREWYEDERTKEMLSQLSGQNEASLKYALHMQRMR